jgi:outer membrane cobalamin receptor
MASLKNLLRLVVACVLLIQQESVWAAQENAFQFFEEEAKVTTASKTSQSISDATSVMTVITADDLARWGTRTLYEALKRVPGFFPTSQATWPLVGSRGLVADGNDHLLLLIDGHAQNSIVGQGYQQQDLIPVLENVKRIEIIRGPGSVLWGSNAVFGVINVITKDGSDEAENRVTTAYGNRDGMASANYLYSFTHDADVSGIMSFSTWKSDGFNRPHRSGSGSAFNQTDAANMHGNVEFPWGVAGDWPAIDKQREGYDLYAKLKIGDNNQLLARMVETSLVYPWDTWLQKNGSDLTMRKNYLEFQRRTEISHALYIDSLIYGDMLLQNRFPTDNALFKASQGSTVMQDQSNEEMAFGTEILGNLQVSEQNHLIAGVKAVRTKIGPNRDARFDSFLNVDSSTVGVRSHCQNRSR